MLTFEISDVQAALQCTSSNAASDKKREAINYLEEFQKSPQAWNVCHQVLSQIDSPNLELQFFASQGLRNKVTYDLSQLDGSLGELKTSLLNLLVLHNQKIVVTQLSIALARLSIQYLEWKNPIVEIIQFLNPYPAKLLGFLKILPEETLNIGPTPLTEDEFNSRTHELIDTIAEDVLKFLITCQETLKSQQAEAGITLEQIIRCLASWSFEFSIDQLLSVQPLISLIFEALAQGNSDPDVFDAAVECLCIILRESRDTFNEQLVLALYEQLLAIQMNLLPNLLNPQIQVIDDEDEQENMDGITRLFVEAGEAWCVFISKSPDVYKSMVTTLLMLTCKNTDLDVVSYTFPFWFNLKQNLVLPRYQRSRDQYIPLYVDLINGIIKHLHYPPNHFDSKETEDKFKEFRYHMGDVLKDCAAVVGTCNALAQPLNRIKEALNGNKSWQYIEAPLFSLRTMAQEISRSENKQLPQIFDIICNLPEHPKIRYASTLVLGRYTEWTSKHPETLNMQLQYIFNGFNHNEKDANIMTASSHALMYFCSDCSEFLSEHMEQLFNFYFNIEDFVDIESQFELCQGLSAVLEKQPEELISGQFQKLLQDNFNKLMEIVPKYKTDTSRYSSEIADKIDLVYAMFEELKPRYEYPQQGQEPLVPQLEFIWNFLQSLLVGIDGFGDSVIIERTTKLLRRIFEKFHLFCEPILSSVAEFLMQGYLTTGLGSYLWCSGSIIVVFGDDESLPIPPQLKEIIWQFAVSQTSNFVAIFGKMDRNVLNDAYEPIMDFFSMASDMLMFYPREFILSDSVLVNVVEVALNSVIKLKNFDAYILILRFLDDLISWGFKTPPISTISLDVIPEEWRRRIIDKVIIAHGTELLTMLFAGLVTNFHANAHTDAVSCIVKCFRLAADANNDDPAVCVQWIYDVTNQLGLVTPKEKENLSHAVVNGLKQKDLRKVREGIRAFVDWYMRKNFQPRFS
ncbi:probable mRNA transport regulator MTR10 [Zygosaccharomyces bailii ISA1307]|nr:probable mRNA transport regulator MTR10 [Zygosaccharomyces bailii ISA1307]